MIAQFHMQAPLRRYIADLERRVVSQAQLIEGLQGKGRNTDQARRTLRVLESALAITREHLHLVSSRQSQHG